MNNIVIKNEKDILELKNNIKYLEQKYHNLDVKLSTIVAAFKIAKDHEQIKELIIFIDKM